MKRTVTKNGASARPRPPLKSLLRTSDKSASSSKTSVKSSALQSAAFRSAKGPITDKRNLEKHSGNGLSHETKASTSKTSSKIKFMLDSELLIKTHDLMIKSRVLEERLIRMYKQSHGYFWIGGPGEEAFNIPLGLNILKGQGLDYDFLHLHYRAAGILISMGAEPIDFLRQMKSVATDPFSGGRNFANHASKRSWNVVPITSTIETQFASAIGTGIAHRRHGGKGITIANGGDAGTAEGEFASALIWSSRPQQELPMLMIVMNNEWGISTPAKTQHSERHIADRGKAFGIETRTINGLDVEESTLAIRDAMAYVRTERKPFLLEARVSRLYGHSSATGANFVTNEVDPIAVFEEKLEAGGILTRKEMDELREKYNQEMLELYKKVIEEPMPDGSTIYDFTYCGQKGRYW